MQSEQASPMLHTLKVILLGNPNVGKKTYIQKLTKNKSQDSSYKNQAGCVSSFINMNSSHGPCQIQLSYLSINHSPLQMQTQTDNSSILTQSDACLIMFSLIDRQSYKSTPIYYRQWMKYHQNSPYCVLVATKVDQKNVLIKAKQIAFHRKKNIKFYNVCANANYNLLKPLEALFRIKLKSLDFMFFQQPKISKDQHQDKIKLLVDAFDAQSAGLMLPVESD